MGDNLLNRLKGLERISIVLTMTAAGLLLASLLYFNFQVIAAPYPHEYREGAIILTTQQLLNQINPYSLAEQPQHTNFYGPLYNLLAYPGALIFGPTLAWHRTLSAIFIILSCGLLYLVLRREKVPRWLALVGSIIYYGQVTSLFSVIARPDSLGLFLFLSAVFIPWWNNFRLRSLLLSAGLLVLSFYTKIYFVLFFPVIAAYVFIFKNKRSAISSAIFFSLLLIIPLLIINRLYPLYLTTNFYYYLGVGTDFWGGLWHVARQIAYFSYKNFAVALIFLAYLINSIRPPFGKLIKKFWLDLREISRSLIRKGTTSVQIDYFSFIFWLAALAFVLKLGQNTGGFVDYIYQLISPFMIIIVWRWLSRKLAIGQFAILGLLLTAGLIFTIFNHRQALDYSEPWRIIEQRIAPYKNIYNEPALTAVLVKQNKNIYDSGHTNGFTAAELRRSPWYPEIKSRLDEYWQGIDKQIINQEFDLVVLDNYGYDLISRDLLSRTYERRDTLLAPMIINSWVLELWEPKNKL